MYSAGHEPFLLHAGQIASYSFQQRLPLCRAVNEAHAAGGGDIYERYMNE